MSLYDFAPMARVAKVHDRKVLDRTACSKILFCFNIISRLIIQYNALKVKLSNLQLDKLKSGRKK